jgi:hypothetical protein
MIVANFILVLKYSSICTAGRGVVSCIGADAAGMMGGGDGARTSVGVGVGDAFLAGTGLFPTSYAGSFPLDINSGGAALAVSIGTGLISIIGKVVGSAEREIKVASGSSYLLFFGGGGDADERALYTSVLESAVFE